MSLYYDPTANNKPGNSSTLYLDNAGFTKQKNNLNNHENTLKLDTSALLTVKEINGTDCVGLLIEHWKDVAGSADLFRGLGCDVLDPALGKMQKSFNTVDAVSASASMYDDVGNCGGDHMSMGEGFNWDFILFNLGVTDEDDELFEFVKQNSLKKTNPDVHDFLKDTKSFDVAAGNVFLDQTLKYTDEEFKSHVGYSRIRDGDFDYRKVTADYRLETDQIIDLNKPLGVEACIQDLFFYYRDNVDLFNATYPGVRLVDANGDLTYEAREIFRDKVVNGIITREYSTYVSPAIMLNKLACFCENNNYNMSFKKLGRSKVLSLSAEISSALNSGRSVVCQAKNVKLKKITDYPVSKSTLSSEPYDGTIGGPEELTVIGVLNTEELVVSYRGYSWVLDLADQGKDTRIDEFYSILITQRPDNIAADLQPTPDTLFDEHKDKLGYEYYKTMERELRFPLEEIDEALKTVGPAYEARLYAIFDKYKGREKEFEQKYGISMYREDGKYNLELFKYILYMESGDARKIDFYDLKQRKQYSIYRRNYYLANPEKFEEIYKKKLFAGQGILAVNLDEICDTEALHTKYDYDNIGEHIVDVHVGGLYWGPVTRDDINDRFKTFVNNHGDNVRIRPMVGIPKKDKMEALFAGNKKPSFDAMREAMNFDGIPTNKEIKDALDHGSKVVFKTSGIQYLEDVNGVQGLTSVQEMKADELTILDIADDGRYIVTIKGNKYYYDAIKYNECCSDYYEITV